MLRSIYCVPPHLPAIAKRLPAMNANDKRIPDARHISYYPSYEQLRVVPLQGSPRLPTGGKIRWLPGAAYRDTDCSSPAHSNHHSDNRYRASFSCKRYIRIIHLGQARSLSLSDFETLDVICLSRSPCITSSP